MPSEIQTARERRKLEQRARRWKYNPEMERLLKLRKDRPEKFEEIATGSTYIAVHAYTSGKAAAKKCGLDTSGRNG